MECVVPMDVGSDDSQRSVSLGWTQLHCAIYKEDLASAITLVRNGFDVNAEDRFKRTPLSIAASKGNIELTKWLLNEGANVNRGFPLHYSSEKGHSEIATHLIKSGADVNLVKNNNYPLIIASRNGHLQVVKILIEAGVDVNVRDLTKATALHNACHSLNMNLISFLTECGCDVNAKDKFELSPLDFCIDDKPEFVKLLLSKGASADSRDNQKSTLLHSSSNPESTLELIKHGADVNATDIRNETPLYTAVESRNSVCAKILLEHGADPNVRSDEGWTALHLAAKNGDRELVKELLGRSDVNAASAQNVIPLHLAAREGHSDVVRLLLEHGSLIDVPSMDVPDVNSYRIKYGAKEGETPLSLAIQKKHEEVVQVLTDHRKKTPLGSCDRLITSVRSNDLEGIKNEDCSSVRDLMGWTLLHHSVSKGFYEMSSKLIKNGLSVNAVDSYGRTPLSIAAARDDVRTIKLLVDNGADVNLGLPLLFAAEKNSFNSVSELIRCKCDINIKNKSFRGSSALIEAASASKSAIVKILLENGANPNDVNKMQETALHNACQFNQVETVRLLLKHGAHVNPVDCCRDIPLVCAALNSDYEIVKMLIDNGADIHWKDSSEWTPLHRAACKKEYETTTELIRAGADINYYNDNVESPLFLSVSKPQMMKILLDNGADVDFCDSEGWSPLHESAFEGNLESVKLLLGHKADVNAGSAENVLPIYLAAIGGHFDVAEELLNGGSYVNPRILDIGTIRVENGYFNMQKSRHIIPGNTPAMGAASKGHSEVVRLLVSRGADLETFQ